MLDYYVRYIALPRTVEGVSIPNDDGTFDIYINSTLPPAKQDAVLQHELRHLKRRWPSRRTLRKSCAAAQRKR